MEADVCYVERLDLWHATERLENRWWNGFGFGDPEAVPSLTIVAEVNPSFDGSRRSAGAFLRDTKGNTWLAHTGRVGGGKKGVGKTAFLDTFSGSVQTVDGYDYVVIGRIDAKDFLDKLAAFVRTVHTFKAGVGNEEMESSDDGEEEEENEEDVGVPDDITDEPWSLDDVFADADAGTRLALLEWLGAAILHAHEQSTSCWAVTRRSGPRLRLLVGSTLAFEIGQDRIGVGLQLSRIPDSVDATADAGKPDYPFARIDHGVARWFSVEKFITRRDEFRSAALQFIERAASSFRNSPYARHHAPELVTEIGKALGAALPQPSHRGVDKAPSHWKIAPGPRAWLWPKCREGGYIAIGWDELGDLSGGDRDEFDARVEKAIVEHPEWKRRSIEQAWRFLNIPIGAKIVANDGTRRVVGIGTVTGPYHYLDEGTGFAHRLPVRWDDVRERVVEQPGWLRTVIRLSPATFASIVDAPSPGEHRSEPPSPAAEPEGEVDFGGLMDQLEGLGSDFPTISWLAICSPSRPSASWSSRAFPARARPSSRWPLPRRSSPWVQPTTVQMLTRRVQEKPSRFASSPTCSSFVGSSFRLSWPRA